MPTDRATLLALADRVKVARASLRPRGHATLRFSVFEDSGWQTTNSKAVSEVLCDLWNIAPALIDLALAAQEERNDRG